MIKKITLYGLLIALAFIFSYIESLIPIFVTIPGIKLGLANIITVMSLILFGVSSAIWISLTRVLLVSITFGNFSLMLYSISGSILSLILMILLKKFKVFDTITISILGAVGHNVGQILLASLLISSFNLFYYLPILMVSGVITGAIIGLSVKEIAKRIVKF